MNCKKILLLCSMTMVLLGCSSNTIEEWRQESEGLTRNIIHELREVQTREQLKAKSKVLKSYFNAMADLVIAVEESKAKASEGAIDADLSTALREELSRLYRLVGGREEIEAAQKEAIYKLQQLKGRPPTLWEKKMEKSDDAFPGHRDA